MQQNGSYRSCWVLAVARSISCQLAQQKVPTTQRAGTQQGDTFWRYTRHSFTANISSPLPSITVTKTKRSQLFLFFFKIIIAFPVAVGYIQWRTVLHWLNINVSAINSSFKRSIIESFNVFYEGIEHITLTFNLLKSMSQSDSNEINNVNIDEIHSNINSPWISIKQLTSSSISINHQNQTSFITATKKCWIHQITHCQYLNKKNTTKSKWLNSVKSNGNVYYDAIKTRQLPLKKKHT